MRKFISALILIILLPGGLLPQDTTSSIPTKNSTKALLLSLALPGAGQLYNGEYIKAGAFVTAVSAFAYETFYENNQASKLLDKRELYSEGSSEYLKLKEQFDNHIYKRNQYVWLWVGATLWAGLDAYIEAELFNFDAHLEMKESGLTLYLSFPLTGKYTSPGAR